MGPPEGEGVCDMAEGSIMAWSSGELLASNSWRNTRFGSTKLAPAQCEHTAHQDQFLFIRPLPTRLQTSSQDLTPVDLQLGHPCNLQEVYARRENKAALLRCEGTPPPGRDAKHAAPPQS